ncbi:MAG: flagellar basal body rod protein FlgB [Candidatus Coatesbacteria bacterium]|nr:flagellar basal body rod protein FlgB [Candidatus Coatesbacteria bacterium]
MEIADNPVFKVLERVLSVSSRRASTVASNIANVDTPGYKAKSFDFDAALAASAEKPTGLQPVRTHPEHLALNEPSLRPVVHENNAASERRDGNTVDIEREMADLLEAELMFSASSRLIAKKIEILKTAISS